MGRTIGIPEVETPVEAAPIVLHKWERVAGKHHTKENGVRVIIVPGDIRLDVAGAHTGDPSWKDLGPVIKEQHKVVAQSFRKEQTKQGWFLFINNNEQPFNDVPLNEEEVDGIINANMENC